MKPNNDSRGATIDSQFRAILRCQKATLVNVLGSLRQVCDSDQLGYQFEPLPDAPCVVLTKAGFAVTVDCAATGLPVCVDRVVILRLDEVRLWEDTLDNA